MTINLPLMEDNITGEDLDDLITFLRGMPRLTQGDQVRAFEEEWSTWLGVRHSLFVNSGSSTNMMTMAALKHHQGLGEVIVPTLTWVSDIVSVIQQNFTPVFVDINPQTLAMDTDAVIQKLNENTRAVFLTHVQGFNGLTDRLLTTLEERKIILIEDVCESHGATFKNRKCGSFGYAANFSFYFAHHMSTIEGGMICTNDSDYYETLRMLRSHGMVREMNSSKRKDAYTEAHPDLSPDFIFALPGWNFRNTEIGAVLGRSQLRRLDANNERRQHNLKLFLKHLDPTMYRTDFAVEGASNYAFNLILAQPDPALRDAVEEALRYAKVEFRRGSSGGGNQLRQPYLSIPWHPADFPEVEHVHFYGYYIGNFPGLDEERILQLCERLNAVTPSGKD